MRQNKKEASNNLFFMSVAQVRNSWNPLIQELKEWALFRNRIETAEVYA